MLFKSCKFVDLTHLITPNIPHWNSSCGFSIEMMLDYDQGFRTQKIAMHAGTGTHMDAPSHFVKGGMSIDDIPIDKLIVPLSVIDVSAKADASYLISPQDVDEYEKKYEPIPKGNFVIGYTGWSRFWPDIERYRNVDQKGLVHFPAFSKETAQLLLNREIAGLGIDTLSPDCDLDFPVHKLLLGNEKYIVENMANCHLLPPKGAYALLFPLNMDSTESPMRAIGVIQTNQ